MGEGKVLSISYDELLLRTRQKLLESKGFQVWSALTFEEAGRLCTRESFDLIIIGHTIPASDKEKLVVQLRATCGTVPILALLRVGQSAQCSADYHLHSIDPKALLDFIQDIVKPKTGSTVTSKSTQQSGV